MTNDFYAISLPNRKWGVRRGKRGKVIETYPSRLKAWNEARRRARGAGGCVFLIDRKTGKVMASNTYGEIDWQN